MRLSDVVASVLELRQRKIESQGIQLEIEDQSEAVVSAVFTELQQVVLNLLINAEQAVAPLDEPRRRIRIRTTDGRNSARLEVEDDGDGVPPGDEAKLFQPFFTTKTVGRGHGPRPVGQLRHHYVARRRRSATAMRMRRGHLLLRIAATT